MKTGLWGRPGVRYRVTRIYTGFGGKPWVWGNVELRRGGWGRGVTLLATDWELVL